MFIHAFIEFISIISGMAFLAIMIFLIIGYFENKYGAKLKFKSFKQFYNINPDRWDLYDGFIVCKYKNELHMTIKEYFHFGFMDYIKYKLWRINLDKRDKERDHAASTARMIAAVKEDIANSERIAQQKTQDSHDILMQYINNLFTDEKFIKKYERLMKELNIK